LSTVVPDLRTVPVEIVECIVEVIVVALCC
jgi:hypothetical protein